MNPHDRPSPPDPSRSPARGCTTRCAARARCVVLVGAPMDAAAFAPLADLLAADHTVLTTDPRGINRSSVDDPDQDSTPRACAPTTCPGCWPTSTPARPPCSAPAAARSARWPSPRPTPSRCTPSIAHEPPLDELLDDREQLRAQTEDMIATYLAGDVAGAWAQVPGHGRTSSCPTAVFEAMFGRRARPAGGRRRALLVRARDARRPPAGSPTSRPCATARPASWSASARSRPASSATAPRARWPRRWASSPPCSPATTSGSPRTPQRFAARLREVLAGS